MANRPRNEGQPVDDIFECELDRIRWIQQHAENELRRRRPDDETDEAAAICRVMIQWACACGDDPALESITRVSRAIEWGKAAA